MQALGDRLTYFELLAIIWCHFSQIILHRVKERKKTETSIILATECRHQNDKLRSFDRLFDLFSLTVSNTVIS